MVGIGNLLILAIDIYIFIIVLQVAVSWLTAFDVINTANAQARNLVNLLRRATDPIYRHIQRYVPPIGGIDITPLIVLIALSLIQNNVIPALFF